LLPLSEFCFGDQHLTKAGIVHDSSGISQDFAGKFPRGQPQAVVHLPPWHVLVVNPDPRPSTAL
jgi:hypothetical protein